MCRKCLIKNCKCNCFKPYQLEEDYEDEEIIELVCKKCLCRIRIRKPLNIILEFE